MQLCPNCDNMILPGTTECPYCGAELTADGGIVGQARVVDQVEEEPTPQPVSLQETFRNVRLPETEYAEPAQFDASQFNRIDDLKPLVVTQPYQPTIVPIASDETHPAVADTSSFWWGILGFFLPIVGFILWFTWHGPMPRRAKTILIGSVLGLLFGGGLFGSCGGGGFYF